MSEPSIVGFMRLHGYTPSGSVEHGAEQHVYTSPKGETLTVKADGNWTLIAPDATVVSSGSNIQELAAYLGFTGKV